MATPDIQPSKQVQQLVDRISELPDGILTHTLSFLTLKDAARTSVLSERWIDVWKFTKRLDFDNYKNLKEMRPTITRDYSGGMHKIKRRKQVKYITWVNKVLQSHKSMELDVFRIFFSDLNETHRDHLHNWIQYAIARKVQKLELNLGATFSEHPFIFPSHLVTRVQSLKSLTLNRISVLGEELEYLLHNCPFLEHLLVEYVWNLKEFKVCEPTRVDVYVTQHSFEPTYSTGDIFSWISCCLLNLEAITLRASVDIDGEWDAAESGNPQLTKLKQFTLVAQMDRNDKSLLPYTSLIRASPNLEKFILKLECTITTVFQARETKKGVRLPLQHLKVVEFEGYYGSTTEVELVEYFVENAVSLERIVVDPRIHFLILLPLVNLNKAPERRLDQKARNLATQQLQHLVPSNVELVIL